MKTSNSESRYQNKNQCAKSSIKICKKVNKKLKIGKEKLKSKKKNRKWEQFIFDLNFVRIGAQYFSITELRNFISFTLVEKNAQFLPVFFTRGMISFINVTLEQVV